MKKRGIHILIFALAIGGINSCKKDVETAPVDLGYEYFPDDIGSYIIYEVDSIAYDDAVQLTPDTTRYLLKEYVQSIFNDNSGRPTMRIERYKKMYNPSVPYDLMQWVISDIWTANRTTTTAEKTEENIRYIKLVFPVVKGKEWNGNAFNTLGQKDYEIISIDKAEVINNISFDSVVTVSQFFMDNAIEYINEEEKFAKHVGLIYKQSENIYHGAGEDTVGYTFTQKIISYGK